MIRHLYRYFLSSPDELPGEYAGGDEVERRVTDHIAGMTDNYALELAEKHGLSISIKR